MFWRHAALRPQMPDKGPLMVQSGGKCAEKGKIFAWISFKEQICLSPKSKLLEEIT